MRTIVDQTKTPAIGKNFWNVKRLSLMAVFIALSAVGSLIKIPSPVGTIGLDSAPGYFSALALGGVEGAIVIAIGHLLTAAVVGFPLSIPISIFIALQMALWAIIYRFIFQKYGRLYSLLSAIFLNGVVSSFTLVPVGGFAMVWGVMPFLIVASAINILIAMLTYQAMSNSKLW